MSSTPEEREQLDQLQRTALALKRMRSRIDALERARSEPIAIIGMGCRFPGVAGDVCGSEEFWRLLRAGEDAIREVPPDRWDVDAYYDPSPDAPGKMYTRWGGFLRGIDRFDAQLFGIAPREAISMDPQQRLLLEVAWEALEHAGQAPDGLKKTQTGIFIGIGIGDYGTIQTSAENIAGIDAYTGTGSGFCFASGRLSYVLGTQGPSLSVDTACSSSLVAIHLACQSLRGQECRIALAGGVNAMLTPAAMLFLAKSRALSPTGRCRTFDAAADGFVRGEGCGLLVLKRLDDAIADGDTVLAVIRSSAINHDGPSSGLTVPNGHAQQSLIRQALQQAQIAPAQVDYVEAHGTGTSLGDPIELRALGAIMGEGRAKDRPLLVGSVKTNIGHLEAAAGIAGVIKVVLALQHGEIPPHLHFRDPTPHIPWDELLVAVPTGPTPWPAQTDRRRVAGISSFGLSGTNAHVLVAEAPPREAADADPPGALHVLSLSAKSEPALRALAARYEQHLVAHPSVSLADLCFTTNTGRAYLSHHLAAVSNSNEQLRGQLADFTAGRESSGLISGQTRVQRPKIAFLCTGQGSQYAGMGRQLYETQPVFRQALDRCAAIAHPHLGLDLRDVLYPGDERRTTNDQRPTTNDQRPTTENQEPRDSKNQETGSAPAPQSSVLSPQSSVLEQTWLTQPALFALEYALAELWRSWGVAPAVVLGHSVGEYVAACIAGIFSLEDGLRLIVERARLMQALPPGGGMLAVFAEEERVRVAVQPYGDDIAVAALNGPRHVVISGRGAALEAVAARFAAEEIRTRRLTVSHAFHSPLMRPILDDFARVVRAVRYTAPRLDVIANLTGDLAAAEMATPEYWIDHVLQPVQFAAAVQTLQRRGYDICVEIGPRPVLLGMARQCLPAGAGDRAPWLWLPSLRPGKKADGEQMLESLAALFAHGVRVDWRGFYQDRSHCKISLPTYPFQQQRYWATPASRAPHTATASGGARPEWERWLYEMAWQLAAPRPAPSPAAAGAWLILAGSAGIGRELAGLLRAQGARCAVVYAGASFARTAADEYVLDPMAPSDFDRLIEEWDGADRAKLSGVVNLWSLEAPFSADMSAENLQHAQVVSCGGALHLAQALARAGGSPAPRLWLVTRGSQPVAQSGVPHPHQAPLWGLGHVIALEHPELRCVCLDIDAAAQPDDAYTLLGELCAPDDEQWIAYRHGARYVSRLARYRPTEYDGASSTLQMPIRSDGAYLISGGLGALGLEVARWMVGQGAGALVLLGRSAASARARAEVTALEQAGARVLVARADVADAEAVAAVLKQIGSTLPPLRGIVHAAGVLDDGMLGQQTWERFRQVMAPKVAGAWNLHTLTSAIPLDFFVCFSSVASAFGSPGQGNYAAANAFLDGLAYYRRGLGLPATSINWGPWANAGMEAGNHDRRIAQGLGMIAAEDGVQALSRLMRDGAAQVCVLPVNWGQFLRQLLPAGHRAFFEAFGPQSAEDPARQLRLREQLVALPAIERRAWLTRQIRTLIAQVLGAESPEQIALREGLFEQGIDSLMALEVKNRLEASSGCVLRQTFVFDYPMVDAMVDYFSRDVFPELFRPQANGTRAPRPSETSAVIDLAQISEEEAEALLIKELEQIQH